LVGQPPVIGYQKKPLMVQAFLQNRAKEALERLVSTVDAKGWINHFLDRQSIET
jgi:hypothetical protein